MNKAATSREIPLAHGTLNGCFGCGDDNDAGLHLKFFLDEEQRVLCRVRLEKQFQGPPGHAHGGIIATLLDEAMSKANRRRNITAMTRHMSLDYRRPVPLESDLVIEGWSEKDAASASGRKHHCSAELRDASGTVLASATGIFVEVTAETLRRYKTK
ncbi:MAG TPA: PaaI family thioesterase [Acidobacteriaceae bacterium]|jgi:acyl-coenzyme A thioesterase PaaI-like protein